MAHPNRRFSRSRRNSRRANWKLSALASSVCPQCKQTKVPHHVCGNCGYYRGRPVVDLGPA